MPCGYRLAKPRQCAATWGRPRNANTFTAFVCCCCVLARWISAGFRCLGSLQSLGTSHSPTAVGNSAVSFSRALPCAALT